MAKITGENCGGPLVCIPCAMKYANKFWFTGKREWAEKYRDHAKRLNKERMRNGILSEQDGKDGS